MISGTRIKVEPHPDVGLVMELYALSKEYRHVWCYDQSVRFGAILARVTPEIGEYRWQSARDESAVLTGLARKIAEAWPSRNEELRRLVRLMRWTMLRLRGTVVIGEQS